MHRLRLGLLVCIWGGFTAARADGAQCLRFDFDPAHLPPPAALVAGEWLRDGALAVHVERTTARPQDRWLDVLVAIDPQAALAQVQTTAVLFAPGVCEPAAAIALVPTGRRARLAMDLRAAGLAAAELLIEVHENGQRTGKVRVDLAASTVPSFAVGARIPIRIDRPRASAGDTAEPVTFGVPFPAGVLWDGTPLRLVTADGRVCASQQEIMARWAPEGSIQWVRFDALVPAGAACFVERGSGSASIAAPVAVTVRDGFHEISTGALVWRVGPSPAPIMEVRYHGATICRAGARGLYVVDQRGRVASSSARDARVTVEAAGPVAACVRVDAPYCTSDNAVLARHITRIEVFAGCAAAAVTHTLVLTEDTRETWFREVGWDFAVAGQDAERAVFNVDRADATQTCAYLLGDGAGVSMLQAQHFRFGAGENRFRVATADGQELHTGAECGDWALLHGSERGWMVACRETARQHPKEFAATAGALSLRLFSPDAGEELDFRTASVLRKLDLPEEDRRSFENLPGNAAGWAKTHELLLAPLAGPGAVMAADAAKLTARLRQPTYALADPPWICATQALGPIHPRDPERFPDLEQVIANRFAYPAERGHELGHYGFVDYFAGPVYGRDISHCAAKRYRLTYGLRSNVWLLYARSGARELREFGAGTNRAFLDNYLTHWDVPGKVRGLFTGRRKPYSRLPLYWEHGYAFDLESSTDLNQFLWFYYLTGYRRAADAVRAFNAGLKRAWTPAAPRADSRVLMMFRVFAQCYGFTWDPETRALAEATFAAFYDQEGELLLSKHRPGGSAYKTQVDVRALIDAWHIFGRPVYREAALRVARHWWLRLIGTNPVTYMNPMGVIGAFLHAETDDVTVPCGLDHMLRRAGGYLHEGLAMSVHAAVFEGIPCAMAVQVELPREYPCRWLAYGDNEQPTAVVFRKDEDRAAELLLQSVPKPEFVQAPQLTTVGIERRAYTPFYRLDLSTTGAARLRVGKDSDGGAYVLTPAGRGEHFVLCTTPEPMVLYAPDSWTTPDLTPARRVYFMLPEDGKDPAIFLEKAASLYDPRGQVYGEEGRVQGWIQLPAEQSGLWSFLPGEPGLVRVRNIPPFFGMGGPESYFLPPVPWADEAQVRQIFPAPPGPEPVQSQ